MKALIFLFPEKFRDEEFQIPKKQLEAAGVDVVVAGLERGAAKGMLGLTAVPDMLLDEVEIDEFDAVIVPGGSGSVTYLWNNPVILSLVKEAYVKGKIVAAICLSGVVLANAGILEGRNATVYASPEALEVFKKKGVCYISEAVVVDGRIVTADGPASAKKFADEIIGLLECK